MTSRMERNSIREIKKDIKDIKEKISNSECGRLYDKLSTDNKNKIIDFANWLAEKQQIK